MIQPKYLGSDQQTQLLPSFFLTSALVLDSALSSFFDLAGEAAAGVVDAAVDVELAAAPVLADLVWSMAFEPHRAHCSSCRMSGATPSSRLTLASTRNGSTPTKKLK